VSGNINQEEIDALLRNMSEKLNRGQAGGPLQPSGEGGSSSPGPGEKMEKHPLVEKVEFAPLKARRAVSGEKKELHFFDRIPLVISGELGTAELTVRDLLNLEEGSIIKLDKIAGESATILLNEQYLGQAEVVVINDRFGLRVTSLGLDEKEELKEEQR